MRCNLKKKDKKYVTTVETDGDVYVDIAEVMTIMGYTMNHCTARNIVLSVMERLVKNIAHARDIRISKDDVRRIAASPEFQSVIVEMLDRIESSSTETV